MSVSLQSYKNATTADLEKLGTGALMKLRKLTFTQAHCDCCGETINDRQREYNTWVGDLGQRVTAVLNTRPHYPNKAQRKEARQRAAKQRA